VVGETLIPQSGTAKDRTIQSPWRGVPERIRRNGSENKNVEAFGRGFIEAEKDTPLRIAPPNAEPLIRRPGSQPRSAGDVFEPLPHALRRWHPTSGGLVLL
jgi:hypothetical protein